MPTPTAQYYLDEAARYRDLAAVDLDRYKAARWREAAGEYECAAALLRTEERAPQRTAVQRQPAQQQQARSVASRPAQPHMSKQIRLACSNCGQTAWLTRIEPAHAPDHDLRTFECPACGHVETVTMKFR
jgi:hypothetical protein